MARASFSQWAASLRLSGSAGACESKMGCSSSRAVRSDRTSLIPVTWAEPRYLVEPKAMEDFCFGVNSGWEGTRPEHSPGFLRLEDRPKPVQGLPHVLVQYRPLLLDQPIEVRVTGVLGPGETRHGGAGTRLRLDRGAAAGLRAGMDMRLGATKGFLLLQVASVGKNESVGVVPDYISRSMPREVGMCFSSRIWKAEGAAAQWSSPCTRSNTAFSSSPTPCRSECP